MSYKEYYKAYSIVIIRIIIKAVIELCLWQISLFSFKIKQILKIKIIIRAVIGMNIRNNVY